MSTKNSSTHTKKYKLILSAVHMVYRLINSTYNVQELILRLTRLLCQFIKASSSSIYILDPKTKKLLLIGIFDNQINILLNKKNQLDKISDEERRVMQGYEVIKEHMIGLPLIADDNVGAIIIRRKSTEQAFSEFDKEMLSVVVEQSVTAIRNLQLAEEQQRTILGSIEVIGKLLERSNVGVQMTHTPVYFSIVKNLAEKLNMNQEGIISLYYASVLHDAGIIDVPYNIITKSGQLSAEEFKIVRDHPYKSVALFRQVEFLKPVLPIILYHHEKYDGTGYPSGLKKEQIPLGARIMAVVDAYEAMTHHRPYKQRLSIHEALEELRSNSGTQFDPKVINAFIELSSQKKFRNYLRLVSR